MITRTEKLQRLLPWLAVITSLAALFGEALLAHMRLASEPGVTNDDVRQQIYPFFRYEDPELFPRDYIADYYLACMPWGFRGLYMIAGYCGVTTEVSKIVPYVGLLITVVSLALISKSFGGKLGAWVAAALCLGSSLYLARMTGGLPRGFAFPFLSLATVALTYGRMRALAVLVPIAASFYPASAVPIGLTLALTLIVLPENSRGEAIGWSFKKRALWVGMTAVAAALVLLPSALASSHYGKVIRPSDIAEFPEAGKGGRYGSDDRGPFPPFIEAAPEVVISAVMGDGEPFVASAKDWVKVDNRTEWLLGAFGLFALGGWIVFVWKRPDARRFVMLAIAAVVAHTIAAPIAPFFYLPQRYVVYPVPILATVILATGAAGYLLLWPRLARARYAVAAAVLVTGLPLLVAFGGHGTPRRGLGNDIRKAADAFVIIERLPKDALIAGWPRSLDNIPYFSRRQVLLTFETHQAFHADYALELRRRMNAVIAAYFATDKAPLIALRRQFGVTHLLLDTHHFRRAPPHYIKPFGPAIDAAVRAAKGDYEVMRLAEHSPTFNRGRNVLIDLRRLEVGPKRR